VVVQDNMVPQSIVLTKEQSIVFRNVYTHVPIDEIIHVSMYQQIIP